MPKRRRPLRPLPPLPHPLPPGPTGCNDVQHGAPVAISDGTRAAPVNLLRPPQQLQRNSDPRRRSWARGSAPDKKDEGSPCSPRP